jgi:hypothetical protein
LPFTFRNPSKALRRKRIYGKRTLLHFPGQRERQIRTNERCHDHVRTGVQQPGVIEEQGAAGESCHDKDTSGTAFGY